LSELHAIKEWPKRPSEYGLCDPESDLIYMLAHDAAYSKMERYEYELMERKRKQKQKGQPFE
jgi:hypothetical protein